MHPELFSVFGYPIPTFGLMVAIGMMLGIRYAQRSVDRIPVDNEYFVTDLAMWTMIAAFAGGRIGYIIVEWETFVQRPWSMIFSRQGYVFYAGFLAAFPVGIWYTRRCKLPLLKILDAVAPAIALGHAFGRGGCYMFGCCYGKACSIDNPLFRFPAGSPAFFDQLDKGLIGKYYFLADPVHPTQLYEMAGLFAMFLILHRLSQKVRWAPGTLFVVYLAGYAVLRFGIELVRDDSRGWFIENVLSTSQGLALLMLGGAVFLYTRVRKAKNSKEEPVADEAEATESE
jgi:phosphatidylglycerol:prolipoprotein diacylglycerol transferase